MATFVMLLRSLTVAFSPSTTAAPSTEPATPATSFRGLSGREAREFRVPSDTVEVWTATYPNGDTQTRYQQYVGQAQVLGDQITVFRNNSGEIPSVIGGHYPGVKPTNLVKLVYANARALAAREIGNSGKWMVTLSIDPDSGHRFYRIDAMRWAYWINATTGCSLLMTDPDGTWDTVTADCRSPEQPAGVDAHYYANVGDNTPRFSGHASAALVVQVTATGGERRNRWVLTPSMLACTSDRPS